MNMIRILELAKTFIGVVFRQGFDGINRLAEGS
jgi:hypothetical protein